MDEVYSVLLDDNRYVPSAFVPVVRRMVEGDWLGSYRSLDGVAAAYERVGRQLRLQPGYLGQAIVVLEARNEILRREFDLLFPRLVELATRFLAVEKGPGS